MVLLVVVIIMDNGDLSTFCLNFCEYMVQQGAAALVPLVRLFAARIS
jgi:dienelactone hydrolase